MKKSNPSLIDHHYSPTSLALLPNKADFKISQFKIINDLQFTKQTTRVHGFLDGIDLPDFHLPPTRFTPQTDHVGSASPSKNARPLNPRVEMINEKPFVKKNNNLSYIQFEN